jgi:cytochrome c
MDPGPQATARPVASFDVNPGRPRAGQTIRISDSSRDERGPGIAWRAWDFGDDNTATGSRPTHRYGIPGNYTITLTVATFDGRVASTARLVTVGPRR